MFTNALKSFTSNITSNYTLSPEPTTYCGPWRIHDAKKKKTNQAVSVWIFERKSLESGGGSSNGLSLRGGGSSRDGLKAAQDEVVERLKKGASLLARLRHPCVLELAEPVEDTRGGGLMFATEAVLSSLSKLLQEKDEEESRSNGRYGRESSIGGRRRADIDIDELEIQKGLLQIGKALEFLHESAALIHGNITPDAVMINAKSDWKLTSLSFTISSTNPPLPPVFDARLPPNVQVNLDYASPELVLDNTISPSTDLFSLGLLIVALYNNPHKPPLETHNSASSYRRLLGTPSTTPNVSNNFLSSKPLPRALVDALLPHLLTRRPAGRITAREFQQNEYFDNILVSALRFLDSLPAKTPSEKSAFMRGLPKVLPQFPRSVLEKKILPGLVEELRDGSMLALVLPNVFAIAEAGSARLFSEKVLQKLKEVFLPTTGISTASTEPKTAAAKIAEREKEAGREGGLTVVISSLPIIMEKTTSREFKEDILPIYQLALESPTHALQDLALRSLVVVLPKLDFPTLKNELFPVVASVFTKTSSLGIKIRGLEAFKVLCGGTPPVNTDGLEGFNKIEKQRAGDCPVLDKYTIQEKVVPLLKGIKTKEPAVMMAALEVFSEIGKICDREIVAMELLPGLWTMSFGPLLGLEQFQAFMATIKSLSSKIEHEQTRKLQELSSSGPSNTSNGAGEFLSFGGIPGANTGSSGGDGDAFADLVFGKTKPSNGTSSPGWGGASSSSNNDIGSSLGPAPQKKQETASFSWSTPSSATHSPPPSMRPQRAATPDSRFAPLTPSSPGIPPPLSSNNSMGMGMGGMGMGVGMGMGMTLQPQPSPGFGSTTALRPQQPQQQQQQTTQSNMGGMTIDWSSVAGTKKPTLSTAPLTPKPSTSTNYGMGMGMGMSQNQNRNNGFPSPQPQPQQQPQQQSHPTILFGQTRQQAAPTPQGTGAFAGFMLPPPPGGGGGGMGMGMGMGGSGGAGAGGGINLVIGSGALAAKKQEKKGLDAWESLL